MTNIFRIGKVITTFGIKGEIKIFPTTDDVKRFEYLKSFYLSDDENADIEKLNTDVSYIVENVKYVKNNPILKIKSIDNVADATLLVGKNLYVRREDAVKLQNNEFYVMDMIGLTAFNGNEKLGEVVDIMKTKANDLLVISYNKKEILVPLVTDFIENIDIEKKTVKIRLVEGLI